MEIEIYLVLQAAGLFIALWRALEAKFNRVHERIDGIYERLPPERIDEVHEHLDQIIERLPPGTPATPTARDRGEPAGAQRNVTPPGTA